MHIALVLTGILLVLATLLPLSKKDHWWIRIFDFPRIQIICLIILVVVAYGFFRSGSPAFDISFVLALFVCLAYHCYKMLPYTVFARPEVQMSRGATEAESVRLVFANVLMDNRRAARLEEIIREVDPDIILTVETDAWWREQLESFERTHPHVVHQPLGNTYGMLFYSRLKLVDPEIKFLVEDDIPSIHTVVKLNSGKEFALHCLHPRPPFPTESERATERDAELLIVGREVKRRAELPAVVMGDLNDVAWSRTNDLFRHISGLLDPRVGRGFYNTFHAKLPFIRMPLDHFFHSNHFRLVELKRLPYFGSDHVPVMIALSYEPDAELAQEEHRVMAEERVEAEEKIKKINEPDDEK